MLCLFHVYAFLKVRPKKVVALLPHQDLPNP